MNGDDADDDPNHKPLTSEEKYSIQGVFANNALEKILPQEDFERLGNSPFAMMANLNLVRELLKDSKKFKMAWDLKLRRLYFYKTNLDKNE